MGDKARRRNPPPVKCKATSKRTGQRCQRWAVVGALVCVNHGAHGGQHGRAHAQELHAARRIEAMVTDMASKVMLAAGFPAEVVQMAGGRVSAPKPDEESTPSDDLLTEEDEGNAMNRSMARLAQSLTRQLQGAAVELAAQQAHVAAQRPETIAGEVVEPEPNHGALASDPGGQPVLPVERRPTHKRVAEDVKRRSAEVHLSVREAQTNLHGRKRVTDAPEPAPEPEEDAWADDLAGWLGVSTDAAA